MNAEQKRAWFVIGLFAIACIGFVVLGITFGFRGAWGAFGVFGLGGLTALIRTRRKAGRARCRHQPPGNGCGGMASYGTFVLGCMGVWFAEFAWQGKDMVSVHLLGVITDLGATAFFTARSVAILVLYGRHVEADDA